METTNVNQITVSTTVKAPAEKVWKYWTEPDHITKWCQASDDWHAPYAENDVKPGGKFKTTMAAKDGSYSFDFEGEYTSVILYNMLEYTMADGRKVKVIFRSKGDLTDIEETFDAENTHSLEQQKQGWQYILESFKMHTESH